MSKQKENCFREKKRAGKEMIALDLFCGAGGASKGLLDAGFKAVIGIDNKPQSEYIEQTDFRLQDVFDYLNETLEFKARLNMINFIWASPPCQAYCTVNNSWKNKGKKYPDLVSKTRRLLLKTGKPFVIENVPTAPLRKDLILCGEMFGLRVLRHRIFEIHGFKCRQPIHKKHAGTVKNRDYVTVTGNGGDDAEHNFSRLNGLKFESKLKTWQIAMGINWIKNKATLTQCVPPKYSEYIGKQFLE